MNTNILYPSSFTFYPLHFFSRHLRLPRSWYLTPDTFPRREGSVSLRKQWVLALLLLVVVVLSAVAVYMWFGGPQVTLLDAVYMAVITITTVGYTEIVDTHANPALRLFNI